ncbi:MAG: DUF4435 domain-containing protein [Candidatus Methanoplasma sp.]|jgi:hypothetical protein|nr:DUF4435 domain-containing protein [Candidatus Methanoplasma sp.]
MIDNLSASDIANQISMLRSAYKGSIIVVEGITDSRLYGKFIDRTEARIIVAHSKDNVKRSVSEVYGRRKDHKVIGIMDADLDRMNGVVYNPPLFLCDKRDQETMMFSSGALEDLLVEYADPELLERFEETNGKIRDVVARAGYPIGLLMFISLQYNIGLSFRDLDHRRFINVRSLAIDVKKMIDEVFYHSQNKSFSKADLFDLISAEEETLDDPWTAVRGHDAIAVLLIGLLNTFGAYNCNGMDDGRLSGALRLAYGPIYFKGSDVCNDVKKWADRNNMSVWLTQ